MKRLVDAHALQTVHELLRIILVVLVDEVGDAHIGRNFQNTCHIYLSITSPVPVVVSHLAAVHIHNTVAVSTSVSGVILPSSSATIMEAVLKVEPGSNISLMALLFIS